MRALLASASAALLLLACATFFGDASRSMFAAPARPMTYVPSATVHAPVRPTAYVAGIQQAPRVAYAQQEAGQSADGAAFVALASGALFGAAAAAVITSRRGAVSTLRMQAEDSSEAPPAAESAPVTPTPPPAPEPEEGFDISKYSMTISIAFVFLVVKGLSSLGIQIGPQ